MGFWKKNPGLFSFIAFMAFVVCFDVGAFLFLKKTSEWKGAKLLKVEIKVDNIVRVFMHEPGAYNFLVSRNGILVPTENYRHSPQRVIIMPDVSREQFMWARVYYKEEEGYGFPQAYLEIHVHSEKDIEGGGWNHGKFGRGQTVVVE